MNNITLITQFSDKLGHENHLDFFENDWLIKEVIDLVEHDPRFKTCFEQSQLIKGSKLSDHINDSFNEELLHYRNSKTVIPALKQLKALKDCCELPEVGLYHYLKAGFSVKDALLHCYNHKYVKHRYIRWEKDITEGIELLISKDMVLCDCLKRNSNKIQKPDGGSVPHLMRYIPKNKP
ncbi:hypothetical protein [Thalassotalea sp. PLHSN55]|uniref:hypothetical protein n=1 Tax=Thalassotalea sp. PLHSN55 TaxID=3435888 RepID=UPI003F84592A